MSANVATGSAPPMSHPVSRSLPGTTSASYTTADIRNVLIAGHHASGKTTLVDALLHQAGAVTRASSVSDGSSFSDYEKEEKDHKHSIYTSILHADHQGKRINFIDTPGSPDLIGAAIACLPAVETVAVVVSAINGVELVTRRIMDAASGRNLPRVIIVNRISEARNLPKIIADIQTAFGPECLPINLPSGSGTGVVDCLLDNTGASDFGSVGAAHTAMLEQIVEMDETLMEKYLVGDEPDYAALHEPFERALCEAHVIPILFTDAKTGIGVHELLDAIANHFPSPLEGNRRPFMSYRQGVATPEHEAEFIYSNDPTKPLLAHVFKVTTDPFVGKLAIFRVHQGKCSGHSQVFIGHNKKSIKLSHVFSLQGKEHREVNEVIAGDIGAVAKIEETHTGDVLHDDHSLDSVHLKPLTFPTPMYGLAVTPKASGDETKLGSMLNKIAEEDLTFRWHTDRQTHEVVINGIGELHLRLVLERLANRGLHVDTRPPKIAYRETITETAEGHHRHKKQTGGSGQFGEVHLRIEPLDRGAGFEFIDEVVGGAIPGQYIPAIEKGVREVLDSGSLAGYPLQDIRVCVTDGKHHPVDSKEVAFKTASKFAFRDAIMKAHPVVLEPYVSLDVMVPEDKLGVITGDLSGKRGRIVGTFNVGSGTVTISATAPLSEVMQYQSQLKSVTGGQGTFDMTLSHYEPVPTQVQKDIVSQYKPKAEDE